jgi:DNA-binding transcriptional ArsR family regulator
MIELQLSTEVLGRTTFGLSPLSETAASIRALTIGPKAAIHRPWIADARPRLADLPIATLVAVAGHLNTLPDFLYPTITRHSADIEEQLEVVSRLGADDIAAGLSHATPNRHLCALLSHGSDAGKVLATDLGIYWRAAIAPYWTRITNTLEEDIGYRASQSFSIGLIRLLGDLHPLISVDQEKLRLDLPAHPDAHYPNAALTLVPCVFISPGLVLTHEIPGRFQILYAARGAARVWENLSEAKRDHRPLADLLGRTRSSVLIALSNPSSTTDLARELGQSPATVSQHLRVLRESGLATSWRVGRVVLYRQTPLAESLIELNHLTFD